VKPPRLLLPLALLLFATAPLWAQEGEPDPELAHARATFHTFSKAAVQAKDDPEKMARARTCLDLSDVDEEAQAKVGAERVLQLRQVLEAVKHVPEGLIPDDPKAEAFVLYRDPGGAGEIVLDRVGRNWLFSGESVEQIPDLAKAVEARRQAAAAAKEKGEPAPDPSGAGPVAKPKVKGPPVAPKYEHVADWLRAHVPDTLRGRAFLLEIWQWIGLALLATLGILVHLVVIRLLAAVIVRALKSQEMEADVKEARNGVRPFGLLVMAGVWWLGLSWLGLHADVLRFVSTGIKTVAAIAGVWGAYRLVDVISGALERKAARSESKFDDLLVPLVRKSLKVAVVAFGAVFVADVLQFSIKSLLAGLGLGGLAFALAAQDTVKNFFGSLTVVLDRPFEVGDWVLIDGIEGSVEELGFRSTRIRTFHNSVITIPNAKLLTAVVDNMGRRQYRRWTTKLGVAYHTTPDQLEALTEGIRELIRTHPYTRKDYFQVYVTGLADSAIEILIYTFFTTPDWGRELRERQRLILDMLRLCEALGVDIAFPTQTLHVVNVNEAETAERAAEDAIRVSTSDEAQNVGRLTAQRLLAPEARRTQRLFANELEMDRRRELEEERRRALQQAKSEEESAEEDEEESEEQKKPIETEARGNDADADGGAGDGGGEG